ncbi:AAA family ATPase [Gemmatimonas sp.]|uniref:AAA family ATPase n=1 Tax=Gemmatimonas sp. TaxID=1962908 RepID=UPI00391F6B69
MTRTSMDPELDSHAATEALAELRTPPPRVALICAADVAPEPVEWLWPGFLPFGKLVGLDGVAGIGKSTMFTDLIARATRGGPMPYDDGRFDPVPVLIAGVEDGWADTVRPRLDAAGADLTRVHFVTACRSGDIVTSHRDVREMIAHAEAVGARWLHIDAIMGALDSEVSANSDHEVRRALGPLKDAAAAAGLLVTFIRHPRKSGGLAVHAGGGSVAFSALARVGLFVGLHPADKEKEQNTQRRVLAVAKSNMARHPSPLAFTVESAMNGAGHIAWHGPVAITADELASPVPPPPVRVDDRQSARSPALAFLEHVLADGVRVPVDTLKARAKADGLAWRTVHRAADDLCVAKKRQGFGGTTVWYLPTEGDDADTPSAPLVPSVPPLSNSPNSGTNGTNGGQVAPMVRVRMVNGCEVDLPADSPDLTELASLIVERTPLG